MDLFRRKQFRNCRAVEEAPRICNAPLPGKTSYKGATFCATHIEFGTDTPNKEGRLKLAKVIVGPHPMPNRDKRYIGRGTSLCARSEPNIPAAYVALWSRLLLLLEKDRRCRQMLSSDNRAMGRFADLIWGA